MTPHLPRTRAIDEETLFHQARAIEDESQRASFLEEQCAGRPELRAAVESLLAVSDRENVFFDRPVIARMDADREVIEDPRGTRIGPYKLIEQIGTGGFGNVYLAEQQAPIRRCVALKMIKPGMDTRQVMARFEAERQALALMDHANIARVLDGGTTAMGRPYFVMELVKGIPLTKYCDEHCLTPRERLTLFVPVCQAVQHAHQKGIIHRDLKPSNVLIAAQDGVPLPKVIDFGVAKALGQSLTERTLVTGFGGIVGTLEYMSPEQAEFNALDVDTRTDIYSLGVLLYELLTGTTPVTKERIQRAAIEDSLRWIREEDPPSPSSRLTDSKDTLASLSAQRKMEPARLTKELRGELDWIVLKCLEKDRNRRYPTANGLIRDIERYLRDEPVEAGPPSTSYRLRKFLQRNRGPVAAASLVLLALIVGILGTSLGMVRAERERVRANQASEQAMRNLAIAKENLDLAVGAVDQFFMQVSADDRLKEHDLRPLRQNLLKSAVEFHQRLLDSRGRDETAHHDLARSHDRLAELTAEIDAPDRAIGHYRQAIDEFEHVLKRHPDDVDTQCELAESLTGLGYLLTFTGNSREADEVFRRGITLLQSILEREPGRSKTAEQLANSLAQQAFVMSMTRRFKEAKIGYRAVIEQWAHLVKDHPDNVTFASQLAHSHMKLGTVTLAESMSNWPDAAAECATALEIQRKAVSDAKASAFERRVLSAVLAEFARIKMISGEAEDAIVLLREAAEHLELLRQEQPSVLSHVHELAVIYSQLGDCERLVGNAQASETAFLKSAELEEDLVARAPGNAIWESLLGKVVMNVGELALRRDQPESALESFNRSIELYDAIHLRDPQFKNVHETLPYVLIQRGKLLAAMGHPEKGMADCDRAVEMTVNQVDRCDNLRLDRAWVRLQSGDFDQAATEASEALDSLADRCDLRFLPPRFVFGARICSRAAQLARNDGSRPDSQRQALASQYEEDAIDMLRSALEGGLSDPTALEAEEFESLQAMPEFAVIQQTVGKHVPD